MIATSFALVSFATAVVVGLYVGNEFFTVVGRAAVVMFGCYLVGLGLGRVAQWAVDEHIAEHQRDNPIPHEGMGDAEEHPPSRAAA